jgi:hypothetical protein
MYILLKDTQGYDKVNELHEVISNTHYDFQENCSKVQS